MNYIKLYVQVTCTDVIVIIVYLANMWVYCHILIYVLAYNAKY